MNDRWPYPGDSPASRARRVAHAYRALAEQADPLGTADLDTIVRQMGETWAVPTPVPTDPDELLTPHQAAELACVGVAALRQYRKRGLLSGVPKGNTYLYRAGDITELFSSKRQRGRRVTDTIPTDGTTVPSG